MEYYFSLQLFKQGINKEERTNVQRHLRDLFCLQTPCAAKEFDHSPSTHCAVSTARSTSTYKLLLFISTSSSSRTLITTLSR